ncbi:hypothetical protein [Chroococcidiopsis sp.]|uniref:hypothetical protein n=1 Tax=Chroococcidiopsis sp. TaxID=3088168 RepID=UPI003F3ACA54
MSNIAIGFFSCQGVGSREQGAGRLGAEEQRSRETRSRGAGENQLPTTNYSLPITHYPLPITHYSLPITNCPLPIPNSKLRFS